MKAIMTILLALAMSSVCCADQKWCLTQKEADSALAFLKNASTIRHFCAPCEDKTWTEEAVNDIKVTKGKVAKCRHLEVNGAELDLAYVHAQDKGEWVNVALSLNMKVKDVPKLLPNP